MSDGTAWQVLNLAPSASVNEVRRCYAALIKEYRPDTHPEAFSRIREAYEHALSVARAREQVQDAKEAPPPLLAASWQITSSSVLPSIQPIKLPFHGTLPLPARSPTEASAGSFHGSAPSHERPLPDGPDAQAIDLGGLLNELEGLRQRATQAPEASVLSALRSLLQQSSRASIDTRQDFEMALLRWFLDAEIPPLLLIFDAGRAFDWHHQEGHPAPHLLTEQGQRRFALLVKLSQDLVFARHIASNRWSRRLFTPGSWVPPMAFTCVLLEARAWTWRWQALCEQAGLTSVKFNQSTLHPAAQGRLNGKVVLSTDVWVGLLVGAVLFYPLANRLAQAWPTASQEWLFFAVPAVCTLLVSVARWSVIEVGRWGARSPRLRWLRASWTTARLHPLASTSAFLVLLGGVSLLVLATDNPTGVEFYFKTLMSCALVAFGAFALAALWGFAVTCERLAFTAFSWREASDRLEMKRLMATHPAPLNAEADAPHAFSFGPRASTWQRLKTIRAAFAWQAHELARGDRPARVGLSIRLTAPPKKQEEASPFSKPKSFFGRWGWFIAFLLLMLLRLTSSWH